MKLFQFLIKSLLVLMPLWVLNSVYLINDPFKVIYEYDNYYDTKKYDNVPVNRDYISTELFIKHNPVYKYDSFIFGSSRALVFSCRDWQKYINGNTFHYFASGETLFGIKNKINLILNKNGQLKNCIVVIDSATLSGTENSSGHLYIKHPLVSGESRTAFQFAFITAFLSNKFFIPYLSEKLNISLPKSWGYGKVIELREATIDTINNDIYFTDSEKHIKEEPQKYYSKYFYKRDTTVSYVSQSVIAPIQFEMLKEIKSNFDRNKTNYKIIIYPAFDCFYFNPADLKFLSEIFGSENVLNYSGKNEITLDISNYYDNIHARPLVGDKILKNIYYFR